MKVHIDDTIAAVSSPVGIGAIGIVRMSGPRAISVAGDIFVSANGKRPESYETYTMHYGRIVDGLGKIIDEVLLSVMRKPKSYTREDVVEINCHGGIVAAKRTLALILERGARMAEPGEFTKRAFLNGRIDLAQAEAVSDIVKAKTDASLKMAQAQLGGGLSERINRLLDEMIDITSHVEAAIDFPEEDIEIARDEKILERLEKAFMAIGELIESADRGMILREGVLAILCGKPNVGKSSLMNFLLRSERVIVTAVPGTTRDTVEEMINVQGVPVRIMDTAGIGDFGDVVGIESNRRTQSCLESADIALFVLDGSSPLEREDTVILDLLRGKNKKIIAVINKTDLPQRLDEREFRAAFGNEAVVSTSAVKRTGAEELERSIANAVWEGRLPPRESSLVANLRHKEALEGAQRYLGLAVGSLRENKSAELVSIDMREAIYHVGLIVGRSVTDDILDRVFEQFCIGK